MVDADVLRRKTAIVIERVAGLRRHGALTAGALKADRDLENTVMMDLLQAIQACSDLAAHVCADERLGAPTTPGRAYDLLAASGRIDADLATRLRQAVGLRNLIVHRYEDLDYERIAAVVRDELDGLLRFVQAFGST